MKLKKVKPSQIKVPELRVTARFSEEERKLLRDSIKEVGIIAPVIVQELEGELVLVDGLHRLEDAIAAGDLPTDVVILDGDMVDLLCRNLFLDHARGKTPVSEMILVIGALYTEYGLDPDQIKERTGLTRDYIEKLIKISLADPEVLEALDKGVIGVGHAFEIARLPLREQQQEVIAKMQVWRFSVAELRQQINQVLEYMKPSATADDSATGTEPKPKPKFHCEGCKSEAEPRYLRPVFLCPDCFGVVWKLGKAHEPPKEEVVEGTQSP